MVELYSAEVPRGHTDLVLAKALLMCYAIQWYKAMKTNVVSRVILIAASWIVIHGCTSVDRVTMIRQEIEAAEPTRDYQVLWVELADGSRLEFDEMRGQLVLAPSDAEHGVRGRLVDGRYLVVPMSDIAAATIEYRRNDGGKTATLIGTSIWIFGVVALSILLSGL